MRRIAILFTAVVVLLAAGCGGGGTASRNTSTRPAFPPQLKNIQQLQAAFNSASREPTLVVLIAPT